MYNDTSSALQSALQWWDHQDFTGDRWLKHADKQMLFAKVNYKSVHLGDSEAGRSVEEYMWGNGSRGMIAWSQMHGNEATATYALHDLLLFIRENEGEEWLERIKSRIHLRVIPMVNPDGAERWSRRTDLNIDPNRDAVALQAKETAMLMDRIKASGAEVAFNLHDQRNMFHLEKTSESAVISFLAPSADYERSVNGTRRKSMNWISHLQKKLKEVHAPGAGKYTDEFYPTAFGENVQKLGIPTILIESGASVNDADRLQARKLNFYLLLEAMYVLADSVVLDSYTEAEYRAIPLNDNKQWDVLLRNVKIGSEGQAKVDLGVRFNYFPNEETGKLDYRAVIGDIGDLSNHCALESVDMDGAWYEGGKSQPKLEMAANFTLLSNGREQSVINGKVKQPSL